MVDSERERLLGYLLEALEDRERESVEKDLKDDPDLQEQLADLRQMLRPLWADDSDFAPSPGLARRTCRLVAAHRPPTPRRPEEELARPRPDRETPVRAMAAVTGLSSETSRFSWLDLSMASGICLVAMLLVFPAIQDSRYNARRTACENNLRGIATSLGQYSQIHSGYFPYVPQEGNGAFAGNFAVALKSSQLLEDDRQVLCPGSPVDRGNDFFVPTTQQLMDVPEGPELSRIRSTSGGDFGYCFGYVHNGQYRGRRNLSRPTFALMADAPGSRWPDYQTANHSGRGQNVMSEDGAVRFLPRPTWDAPRDHIYLNGAGAVAAGIDVHDSVIGPSSSTPFILISGPR